MMKKMVNKVKFYAGEMKDAMNKFFHEINMEKARERLTGAQLMLAVLAIASIAKHGFKEHMRRAWTTEPVKQFLLGVIAAFALVISCHEKDDDNL